MIGTIEENGLKALKKWWIFIRFGGERDVISSVRSGEIQMHSYFEHSTSKIPQVRDLFLCDRAMRSRFPSKTRPQLGLWNASRVETRLGAAIISNYISRSFHFGFGFLSRPFPFLFQFFSFNLIPDRLYDL
jgi:hypothetical protein